MTKTTIQNTISVLPDLCHSLGIKPRDMIEVETINGEIRIRKARKSFDEIERACVGFVKPYTYGPISCRATFCGAERGSDVITYCSVYKDGRWRTGHAVYVKEGNDWPFSRRVGQAIALARALGIDPEKIYE